VTAFLFEIGEWYETDSPLMELESDEVLTAQKRHLKLLVADKASPDEKKIDDSTNREAESAEAQDGTSETEQAEPGTEEDSLLSSEQRGQMESLGLPEAAIVQMEQKMKALMGSANMPSPMTAMPDMSPDSGEEEPEPAEESEEITTEDANQVPVMTLDDSRRKLRSMGLRKEDIEQLETEQKPSSKITLYAGHAGKIMNLKIAEGDSFEAGTFLFRLGGQVRAIVLANAFQRDAAWISTGYRVEVRMPHVSGEVWEGIVNQGAVSINPNSQSIGVKLAFTAPQNKVRSNLYVVGTIYGDARKNVLAVPREAVIRTEKEERVVVALGGGRFQPVVVTTGVEAGGDVEIIEGLEEGDQVVVMSQFLIDSESSLKASFQRLGEE
jgi:multidrug efflux pump subunit AcrA (membrane-fusion protein)